jgi:predicted metalloprotease
MRWRRVRSKHVRDQRGAAPGGSAFPVPIGKAGLPVAILALLAFLLVRVLGGGAGLDVPGIEQLPQAVPEAGQSIPPEADPDRDLVGFVSFVLDDVQESWDGQFVRAGERYRPADLVLFSQATQSGCGSATSDVGPFYCPPDQTVYLDLDFLRELHRSFGAPGDFAQAYVITHEIGHHVQNLLGVSDRVRELQEQRPDEANELSIRLELQADCLAGVWGFTARQRGILEPGDVEEGLAAAAAVGDDRIQRKATGSTHPESWTHGSSEQRTRWFSRGFRSGDPDSCDTFAGEV